MKNNQKFTKRYFYIGVTAFLVVAACVLFFFVIYRLPQIFSYLGKLFNILQPIIIGLIIAYLVNPIANSLHGLLLKFVNRRMKGNPTAKKIANGISVFGALAVFLAILILIIYMVVPQFIVSITSLVKNLPGQLDTFTKKITKEVQRNTQLLEVINTVYEYGKHWLQTDLAATVSSFATYFASGVWSVVNFIKNFAIGFIFAMYILFNKKILMRQFRKIMFAFLNRSLVQKIFTTGQHAHKIFSGFIYGKLLDSFIIGVLCFIGVTVMRMPYTMLVAVVIGVTNIIPVFGPYIGAIPCAALILLYNPMKGLYFIIFIILLQAFDGNLLGPKILGNSTGLSAFWVMFAIVMGGGLFGVPGMLIGVPLFAVIYYLATALVNNFARKKGIPTSSDFYDGEVCEKLCGAEEKAPPADSPEEPAQKEEPADEP